MYVRDLIELAGRASDDVDRDPVGEPRTRERRDPAERIAVVHRARDLLRRLGEENSSIDRLFLFADIANHEDDAEQLSAPVPDRSGAVGDGDLSAVAAAKHRVIREAHDHAALEDLLHGILDREAGLLVEDRKHLVNVAAD